MSGSHLNALLAAMQVSSHIVTVPSLIATIECLASQGHRTVYIQAHLTVPRQPDQTLDRRIGRDVQPEG